MIDRLRRAAERASIRPGFLAHQLDGFDVVEIGRRLACDEATVYRLLLCRTPRPDRFAGDVVELAAYAGVDQDALTDLLAGVGRPV